MKQVSLRLRVHQIFHSIDGEFNGYNGAGELATFIRLSGCNLRCTWCFGEKPGRRRPRAITCSGKNRPISELQIGDKLLAFDENQKIVETTVEQVFSRTVFDHYEVKIEGSPVLYVTPEHPFFTTKGWKEAQNLNSGDILYHIQPSDKASFRMRGLKNPMHVLETVQKRLESIDYEQIRKEISRTIQQKKKENTYYSTWSILTEEQKNHLRNLNSSRMKNNNPMKDPEIAQKALQTRRNLGHDKGYKRTLEYRRKQREAKLGSRNPRYRGGLERSYLKLWDRTRKDILERDHHTCQCCGTKSRLEIHHIIPFRISQNNTYNNLITLCKTCHLRTENAIPLQNGLEVLSVKKIRGKALTVYNLQCAPYNNFFVEYIAVHNCDTKYAQEMVWGKARSTALMVKKIRPGTKITITGGEPLLQPEGLTDLVARLRRKNCRISIETNGSLPIPLDMHHNDLVRFIVDYKLPSSGMSANMCWDRPPFTQLKRGDVVKFVIANICEYYEALNVVDALRNRFMSWRDAAPTMVFSPAIDNQHDYTGWPAALAKRMISEKVAMIQYSLQIHKVLWPYATKER